MIELDEREGEGGCGKTFYSNFDIQRRWEKFKGREEEESFIFTCMSLGSIKQKWNALNIKDIL